MSRYSVILIGAVSLMVQASMAGTEAGNGDYCEQKGAVCKRTNFNISGKHPQHDELVDLIRSKELPRQLQTEMLRDLEETQVVYSDESIRHKDLVARYEMQLNEVSRKTIYDRNGQVVKREVYEKWERVARLPNLGIYLNHEHVGYQAGDEDQLWVRAITQISPRKVIYFSKFVNKMSRSDQMKLVLHEQGHRLNYLAAFYSDERVVEGWADQLLGYLTGRVSKDQFYATMAAYKLNINGRFNFGPRKRVGTKVSYVEVPILLNKDNIIGSTTSNKYSVRLAVRREAFNNYPGLNVVDQMILIPGVTMEGMEYIDRFVEPIVNGQQTGEMNVRVYFTTKEINRDGMLSTSDEIKKMVLSSTPVEQMYLEVQTLLKDSFSQIRPNQIFYDKSEKSITAGTIEFAEPVPQIYGRPELLFNPNFSAYKTNLVRAATKLTQELQMMMAAGDPLASLLKDLVGAFYRTHSRLEVINGDLDEIRIKYASYGDIESPKDTVDLRPLILSFSTESKVIFRPWGGYDKYLQLEIHVTEQMTDSDIANIVRAGIEEARKMFGPYLPKTQSTK